MKSLQKKVKKTTYMAKITDFLNYHSRFNRIFLWSNREWFLWICSNLSNAAMKCPRMPGPLYCCSLEFMICCLSLSLALSLLLSLSLSLSLLLCILLREERESERCSQWKFPAKSSLWILFALFLSLSSSFALYLVETDRKRVAEKEQQSDGELNPGLYILANKMWARQLAWRDEQ